jgi:integrase
LRAVNNASKLVGLWSEEDGREAVGLHDLRHSAASFYFKQGLKTRDVSRLLRHANGQVTITVYGGLAPKEKRRSPTEPWRRSRPWGCDVDVARSVWRC